jgi:enoyl-CoA hydratase/carnithine racemase
MIRTETRGYVLEVTIDRPDAMNALSPEMSRDLSAVLSDFEENDDLRVLLVTGAGDRAFCAGADLGRMEQTLEGSHGDVAHPREESVPFWEVNVTKPIVAAINGHCLAAGLGLALLTDVRIAAENATFGCMGTVRGIVPGAGQTQRLVRQIGHVNAMWLLLSGERIDANEALRMGLVHKVAPQASVISLAREAADFLASRAPLAVRAAKRAALRGAELPLVAGLRVEAELAAPVRQSEDAREGIRAFMERRPPEFRGR